MVDLDFVQALPAEAPRELTVYALTSPRVNQSGLLEMARRWLPQQAEAHRAEFTRYEGWTLLRHGPSIVAQNRRSGAVRLQDDGRYGRPPVGPFAVPEARLVEVSRNFVAELRLLDTPAQSLAVGRITYSSIQAASTAGDLTPVQVLDAGVVFTRVIDGVPVAGPGGHLTTYILGDESVVACMKVWRDIAGPSDAASVYPREWGVEQLKRRLHKRGIDGAVKVLKAQFGYFEAGAVDRQRYLEPSYAFVFETQVAGGAYKSVEIIPAVERPKQKWRHPKPQPAPEVLRARGG